MPTINEAANDWLRDGTAETAPETTSTPAVEAEAPAETSSGPARDPETGKFVSTASAEAAATADEGTVATTPAAEATTPAATEAAQAQAVEEYLEVLRSNGEKFQLPKDLQVPWKRGAESGVLPITEVLKSPMLERDYRIKTQEAAEQRRQNAIEAARIKAEKEAIEAEREQLRAAMIDPEKLEQYQQHYEMLRTNPLYRKNVEDALKQRVTEAELNIRLEAEADQVNREAAENLYATIVETAKQYPGVDPERVREIYAKALVNGDIQEITEASIHQVYKQEADYAARTVAPLQAELTELRAQIAALSTSKAAEAHNAKTDQALAKAKAQPVVAATGNATAVGTAPPVTKFKPFTSQELPEKLREWSRR